MLMNLIEWLAQQALGSTSRNYSQNNWGTKSYVPFTAVRSSPSGSLQISCSVRIRSASPEPWTSDPRRAQPDLHKQSGCLCSFSSSHSLAQNWSPVWMCLFYGIKIVSETLSCKDIWNAVFSFWQKQNPPHKNSPQNTFWTSHSVLFFLLSFWSLFYGFLNIFLIVSS